MSTVTQPSAPGTSLSAIKLISSALRLIGVIASGETAPADAANDSLEVLNMMIDGWNADRLTIYTIAINDFPFVANKQTYTLGTGGDFNIPRPPEITGASVVLLTNPGQPLERPLRIAINEKEWQDVSLKAVVSTFALIMYDDGAFPLRNLSFWPIPQEVDNFRLYSWQPLAQWSSLATVLTFPPGYYEAIRYNLAVRLAEEFNAPQSPGIVALANSSLAKIKTANIPMNKLKCDEAYVGTSDPGLTNYRSELFNIP